MTKNYEKKTWTVESALVWFKIEFSGEWTRCIRCNELHRAGCVCPNCNLGRD